MSKAKRALLAATASVIFVGVAGWFFNCYGHIGGDGPDTIGWIGLVLFLPAICIGQGLASCMTITGVPFPENTLTLVFGVLQYFIVFWFVLWLASKFGRHNKHLQATPR